MVINTTRYLHKWCDYVNMCTCSHIQHALKHLYLHAPGTDGSLVWHMPLSPCFFLFVWADHGDSKHDHFINLVPWSLLLKGCLSTVVPSIRSKGHSTVKWGQVFCAQSGTFRGCGFCKISFLQWAGATPGVIVEAIGILIVLCSFSKGHTNQWDWTQYLHWYPFRCAFVCYDFIPTPTTYIYIPYSPTNFGLTI